MSRITDSVLIVAMSCTIDCTACSRTIVSSTLHRASSGSRSDATFDAPPTRGAKPPSCFAIESKISSSVSRCIMSSGTISEIVSSGPTLDATVVSFLMSSACGGTNCGGCAGEWDGGGGCAGE